MPNWIHILGKEASIKLGITLKFSRVVQILYMRKKNLNFINWICFYLGWTSQIQKLKTHGIFISLLMLPVLQWCYIPVFLFLLNQIFFFFKKKTQIYYIAVLQVRCLVCVSLGWCQGVNRSPFFSREFRGEAFFCTYLLIDCWQNAVSCGHGLKLTPLPSWLSAECIPSF